MNKKLSLLIVLAIAFMVAFSVSAANADMKCGGMKCHGMNMNNKDGLEDKFFQKAHFLMENKDEIGLSDSQLADIKNTKMGLKKDMIMKDAQIEVLAMDIKSGMYDEMIDVGKINALIDQKYDLKKERAKAIVAAYAKIKESLTPEQKEKMKAVWKKGTGHEGKCPMCGSMKMGDKT